MLSSLSKSRISIFNVHLTLFVHRMTSHNSIGKYRHLVNWLGTCLGKDRRRWQTRQVESLQNWKEVNVGRLWLFSKLTLNLFWHRYSRIVSKLYQFHIVTVLSYALFLTTLSFVLWLIVASTASSYLLLLVLFSAAMSKRSCKTTMKVMECSMPFKWTGYCRLRSKDGKFKPRRRIMQNLLLYSAKWSHLNKDKWDCRTQLVKQFVHCWRHLKRGL